MSETWGSGPKRQMPAGLDLFDKPAAPRVEPVDALSRFVLDQVRAQETEPRTDQVPQNHDKEPTAYRYAAKVREDCVVFRRIVALYVDAIAAIGKAEEGSEREAKEDQALGLQLAVAAIAARWAMLPGYQEEWRVVP